MLTRSFASLGVTSIAAIRVSLVGGGALLCVGIAVLFIPAAFGLQACRRRIAVRRFRDTYSVHGRDLLIVYSASPHWQRYVEEHWLPRWGPRAVILNWSERAKWRDSGSVEAALFFAVGGTEQFNPLVIVVPSHGDITIVRFWKAFRAFKKGRDRLVLESERQVEEAIARADVQS